ncbi:efflux transporter outer membrane subunit [Candidatus Binatia bacterium]|nr:efflux transporter outer membrane subunit [Candidatus Binatia bacterium]
MKQSSERLLHLAGSLVTAVAATLCAAGCMMVGPDYDRPAAPAAERWLETRDAAIGQERADYTAWWTVFDDPTLTALVETAYRQNPSLQAAGARVLAAEAFRGIAIGTLYPQMQQGAGAYTYTRASRNQANSSGPTVDTTFPDWSVGLDAAWELDVWGRFRRGIESADAQLLASVAAYDDALVSLVAEVALNYISLRTFEEQLAVARSNVEIQEGSYGIVSEKFRGGAVTRLDERQAASLLDDTRSLIPGLEASIRQTQSTLCLLLGLPPQDLNDILGGTRPIPAAPTQVAVGIPADLLRRRPDIRRAERVLAAQSAQIGVAKSELLPRFILVGSIGVASQDVADLFTQSSFQAFGGPSFRWAILNYGRIINNVRVQDATYQALVSEYENTVLLAQSEVERAIAAFLGARRQVDFLARSVEAARDAVELADLQYREGAADYTRVLNTQQVLLSEQGRLVATRGAVALNLTALYRALGGGWELREGKDFVPPEAAKQMRERTYWGDRLSSAEQQEAPGEAAAGTESERGWWRWRWWWPQW